MSYEIRIDNFAGPLDLLLHLIRKNEMDIHDIPIAEITSQYIAFLDDMQSLNLEIAGEFLVMAATLLHIKSRLLLPSSSDDSEEEPEEDPRAELVRRLLDYQRYCEAASALDALPQLQRDVFARRCIDPALSDEHTEELAEIGLFRLVEAFHALQREVAPQTAHTITTESLSVAERMRELFERLQHQPRLRFRALFSATPSRQELVVTFLAMLEMVKMRAIFLMQEAPFAPIWIQRGENLEPDAAPAEKSLGYG